MMKKYPGVMLSEIWRHLIKKPATALYPLERPRIPENFRGKIEYYDDKCIRCGLCARDCPSGACTMKKFEEDKKPRPVFDLSICLFCGQCAEVCPKDAIFLSKKFEFSTFDKRSLIVE